MILISGKRRYEVKITKENLRIRENERVSYTQKLARALEDMIPSDRYSIIVDVK